MHLLRLRGIPKADERLAAPVVIPPFRDLGCRLPVPEEWSSGSQSEVVREGLRLWIERDRLNEVRLEQMRSEIARGVEEARRDELVAVDVVRKDIKSASREKRCRAG
jgi:antitoxin ParD1/3/4